MQSKSDLPFFLLASSGCAAMAVCAHARLSTRLGRLGGSSQTPAFLSHRGSHSTAAADGAEQGQGGA